MTLSSLKMNETATIIGCSNKRLCDLGLICGVKIRIVKQGNTCIIRFNNTSLCMGYKYQKIIEIERK